mmetsp:Transcript_23611/g.57183  ORF Transcript_23611/g.57183 Transcript_23611/m.57183 type:complete len:211 (+) Transcript_23611:2633-3265(+)
MAIKGDAEPFLPPFSSLPLASPVALLWYVAETSRATIPPLNRRARSALCIKPLTSALYFDLNTSNTFVRRMESAVEWPGLPLAFLAVVRMEKLRVCMSPAVVLASSKDLQPVTTAAFLSSFRAIISDKAPAPEPQSSEEHADMRVPSQTIVSGASSLLFPPNLSLIIIVEALMSRKNDPITAADLGGSAPETLENACKLVACSPVCHSAM